MSRAAHFLFIVSAFVGISLLPHRIVAAESDNCETDFFEASDGARVQYFTCGDVDDPAILISPAFTGSAELYANEFGRYLTDYYLVGVELRGHGKGGGCEFEDISYCTQSQAPDQGDYYGFRISRLAADLLETKNHLELSKSAIMGHSLGGNVLYSFVSSYGLDEISGLFIYDQSPKNLADGTAENATFPTGIASYPMDSFERLVRKLPSYKPDLGYHNVESGVRKMLGGGNRPPVFNPRDPGPAFVLTEEGWERWAPFAYNMNGKVLSLLFWNTLVNTYSDVFLQIANSGVPVLVYAGKASIVNWRAMQWVHEQIPDSELILMDEEVGVHASFLNPPPSGPEFMNRVRDFFDRRVRPEVD